MVETGPAPGLRVVLLSIWLTLPGLLPFPSLGGRRLLWWGVSCGGEAGSSWASLEALLWAPAGVGQTSHPPDLHPLCCGSIGCLPISGGG